MAPSARALHGAIDAKALQWRAVVKIGRTHLEDAVPLTVGQEWSGFARQLEQAIERLEQAADGLYELAAGGTAVGTGLNAPPGFAADVAERIAAQTGYPFRTRRTSSRRSPGPTRWPPPPPGCAGSPCR